MLQRSRNRSKVPVHCFRMKVTACRAGSTSAAFMNTVKGISLCGQAVEDERRDLSRSRRVEVREDDDHIPAVRFERELPVHPRRATAVPDESPATHDAVDEPVCVLLPRERLNLPIE